MHKVKRHKLITSKVITMPMKRTGGSLDLKESSQRGEAITAHSHTTKSKFYFYFKPVDCMYSEEKTSVSVI